MLLNAVVQTMQQPAMIVGFLDKYRHVPSITRAYFRQVSDDYHRFVSRLAAQQDVPIVEPPKGVRREDWVEPYYRRLGSQCGIAVILKSRENARIAVSYATPSGGNRIAGRPARASGAPGGGRRRCVRHASRRDDLGHRSYDTGMTHLWRIESALRVSVVLDMRAA